MIEKEDFEAWLQHPVTKEVKAILGARREQLRQQWEGGSFIDYDKSTTVLVNVGNVGTCKGYAFVMELDYEQYLTEIDDGKSERVETPGSSSADQAV